MTIHIIRNRYNHRNILFQGEYSTRSACVQDAVSRNINLFDADLTGINLRYAFLANARLHGADLKGCDLSHADLNNANLFFANLRDCRLKQTNLQGADLERAKYDYYEIAKAIRR